VRLVTAGDDSRRANRGEAGTEDGGQIGWATEAKDWAGELISGQSTTGRILVGLSLTHTHTRTHTQLYSPTKTATRSRRRPVNAHFISIR